MASINVQFTLGPAYFGDAKLIRNVTEILLQSAMGDTHEIVTYLRTTKNPEIGVLAEVDAPAHPEAPKQIAAAIRQAMLLQPTVPVLIVFSETDVMEDENIDNLLDGVQRAQKALKEVTDDMFDRFLAYY